MNRSRVLVLNNYSLNRVTWEILQNVKPTHHLYGIIEMHQNKFIFDYIDPDTNHILFKIGKWLQKIPLFYFGDLYVQYKALLQHKNYNVIYAPCQDCTILLGVLSYFNIIHTPIVALAHHPILTGRFSHIRRFTSYFYIKGHTHFPALSQVVSDQINRVVSTKLSQELYWGPDIDFYKKQKQNTLREINKDIDVVAIGRTGRDYLTLIKAFNNTSIRVAIFCHEKFQHQLSLQITNNISMHFLQNAEQLNYKNLIDIYARSKILAIPMMPQDSLCGLTSILDGIAMGMPIIATFNKYININIELLGIGCWINPYDEKEWRKASVKILSDPILYKSMTEKSMTLVQDKFNIKKFANSISQLLKTAS